MLFRKNNTCKPFTFNFLLFSCKKRIVTYMQFLCFFKNDKISFKNGDDVILDLNQIGHFSYNFEIWNIGTDLKYFNSLNSNPNAVSNFK